MTAKQYLKQIQTLHQNIIVLTEEIEERRTKLTSTAAPVLSDRVQTSHHGDVFADMMAALADREVFLEEMIYTYTELRDRLVAQILELEDGVQSRVLYERYVLNKQWQQIADEMHYSIQRIFQIHGNALTAFSARHPEL